MIKPEGGAAVADASGSAGANTRECSMVFNPIPASAVGCNGPAQLLVISAANLSVSLLATMHLVDEMTSTPQFAVMPVDPATGS